MFEKKPRYFIKATSLLLSMALFLFYFLAMPVWAAGQPQVITQPESQAVTDGQSTFLALGDSIAYGMSAAQGNDYVDLLYKHLLTIPADSQLSLNNLAVSGDTSSALLARLQTPQYMAAVSNAKVITLSIGGDNLLSPVIGAVAKAFGVNSVNNPNFTTDLAKAMSANPNKDVILSGLANSPALTQALQAGVSQFSTDFPQIIGALKTLAPQAQIYVLNLYNPFNEQDPLYATFDPLIRGINQVLNTNAAAGYQAADVYTQFRKTSGAVNFNLATLQLDPHPTTIGHAAIYQAILNAESGQIPAAYYTVSVSPLTGGSITANAISAAAGTEITLTVTPSAGMQLKSGTLKYNDGTQDYVISGTSFSMPASNVSISAEFETAATGNIPAGTVIFAANGQALDLDYANNPAHLDEVMQDITNGGNIYVVTFSGKIIDNITGSELTDLSKLPAVTYKDANGNFKHFAAGDGPVVIND